MNPFQRALEGARAARKRLLGDRSDSVVSPSELFATVEDAFQVVVMYVSSDHHDLSGGSATFIRQTRSILIRNDADSSESAFFLAHELGHCELDPPDAGISVTKDADIRGEFLSPATMVVEAYGARMREELQANLFARELLLPRSLAKSLYLKGWGARKAAAESKISLEVARQQMLDGVFLPEHVESPAQTRISLSEDQEAAAKAPEKHVRVVAGPGTGKTSTLIERIKHLLHTGVNPRHILVLTFSNKAAREIADRLYGIGMADTNSIWVGTFHAFGLEFLRKYSQYFELRDDFAVADTLAQFNLLEKSLSKLTLRHYLRTDDPQDWLGLILKTINRLKEEMISPAGYRDRVQAFETPDDTYKQQLLDAADLFAGYESALKGSRMVDFTDLVALPAKALAKDRAKYGEIADRFQYVLVDEYQDMNRAAAELLIEMSRNAKSVWVVGDLRQAIYRWRGASLKNLLQFNDDFPDPRTYPLRINRRSSNEIYQLVESIGIASSLQRRLPLPKGSASMGSISILPTRTVADDAEAMVEEIERCIKQDVIAGVPYRQQAVICRMNDDVTNTAVALAAKGMPVLHIGEIFERPEIKALLCAMQLLVSTVPTSLIGLSKVLPASLSDNDIIVAIRSVQADRFAARLSWLSNPVEAISPTGKEALRHLAVVLKGLAWSTNPWEAVCGLLLESRTFAGNIESTEVYEAVSRIALWQFAQLTRAADSEGRRMTVSRFLARTRQRIRLAEALILRELPPEADSIDAVRFLTVHTSKGLEYESVHFAGLNGINFDGPGKGQELIPAECFGISEDLENEETTIERENLLYVGISRAKRRLHLYENRDAYKYTPPKALVDTGMLIRDVAQVRRPFKLSSGAAAPGAIKPFTTQLEDISNYEFCPRQYRYKTVLSVEGAKELPVGYRARAATKAALRRALASDESSKSGIMAAEWETHGLPPPEEDSQLWSEALRAYERGMDAAIGMNGEFSTATVVFMGVSVVLPEALTVTGPQSIVFVRFEHSFDASRYNSLYGPLLRLLSQKAGKTVSLKVVLLRGGEPIVLEAWQNSSARRLEKAVRGLASGQFPLTTFTRNCKRCEYNFVCPSDVQVTI